MDSSFGTDDGSQAGLASEPGALADEVRSLPERFRTLFSDDSLEASGEDRSGRRPSHDSPAASEHVICIRKGLENAGDLIERVAHAARAVPARTHIAQPIAGYYRWRPENLLSGLAAETERLAHVIDDLANDDMLPESVRMGLHLIAAELVRQIMRDAVEHLREARLAMTS